jgi:acyl-CoA synthetase (AMP-forming)/AMP-acid ligase II
MQLLHHILAAHAKATPQSPAWHADGQWRSWAEAHDRVHRIAGNLRLLGLMPGDRVAVFGENSADLAELFIAIGAAGLVAVPVNPRSVRSEIEFICGEVQARGLVVTAALAPNGRASLVLTAIRKALRNGAMIAGSSAGAAIMSEVMISGGTSLEAATYGVVGDPDQPEVMQH